MTDHTRTLIGAAWPYWEAEAEIARRFFDGKPNRDDHIFWLKAQLWKELHPVDGYFSGIHKELSRLAALFPRIDHDLDRHHFAAQLKQMLEEFNHYVLFADIFEHLVGRKLDPAELIQLPEEKRLGDLRRRYAGSGSPLDRAAVLFTEGGGARLFREGARITGGELETMIARAMRVIYDDEKDHFLEGAREIAPLIASPEDEARMMAAIIDVSRQRVAMRLEMFRHPLTADEVESCIARRVDAVREGRLPDGF